MRTVEQPTVAIDRDGTETIRHPAFGAVSVHVMQCRPGLSLHGSDFLHGRVIKLSIHEADMRRDLSHDWHHPGRMITEIHMSESQWATFVSSMNMGSGTPCTLIRRETSPEIPELPAPTPRTEQFKGEARERLERPIAALKELDKAIDAAGLPKARAAGLRNMVAKALQDLQSNLPFVAKSFDQHMERTVDAARAEVHGYVNSVVRTAGLQAIAAGQAPVIMLPGEQQPPEE